MTFPITSPFPQFGPKAKGQSELGLLPRYVGSIRYTCTVLSVTIPSPCYMYMYIKVYNA
jgi:hypothetical protein